MPNAPTTSIVPLGSRCALCGRADGERHDAACVVGSPVARIRARVAAALSRAESQNQAYEAMAVLEDAAADCENDVDAMHARMTLAEAREAFAHMQNDEATSIALDGLETLFGESFVDVSRVVPLGLAAPARSVGKTTLGVATTALELRLDEVNAELAQAQHQRHYHQGTPVAEARDELASEVAIIEAALAELRAALAS